MDFVTIREIAEDWRISSMTVYRWVSSGELPSYRVGRTIRVTREDYEAFNQTKKKQASRDNSAA